MGMALSGRLCGHCKEFTAKRWVLGLDVIHRDYGQDMIVFACNAEHAQAQYITRDEERSRNDAEILD